MSNDAILPFSRRKTKSSVIGLPGKLPETFVATIVFPSRSTLSVEGRREFEVVPPTQVTGSLARRMGGRAHATGIEIALADGCGNVFEVAAAD
jgi:hypothetical protein